MDPTFDEETPASAFVSPRPRGRLPRRLIQLAIAVTALQIVWTSLGIAVMGGLIPEPALEAWWETFDAVDAGLGLGILASILLAGPFFVSWQRALIRNLRAFGCRDPEPGIGWASWAWIVPIANLFVPYRSFSEIALYSAPEPDRSARSVVSAWWSTWIAYTLLSRVVHRLLARVETPEAWIQTSALSLLALGLLVTSGVFALKLIEVLTRQQVEKAEAGAWVAAAPELEIGAG